MEGYLNLHEGSCATIKYRFASAYAAVCTCKRTLVRAKKSYNIVIFKEITPGLLNNKELIDDPEPPEVESVRNQFNQLKSDFHKLEERVHKLETYNTILQQCIRELGGNKVLSNVEVKIDGQAIRI